jgi:hypothetical protein
MKTLLLASVLMFTVAAMPASARAHSVSDAGKSVSAKPKACTWTDWWTGWYVGEWENPDGTVTYQFLTNNYQTLYTCVS